MLKVLGIARDNNINVISMSHLSKQCVFVVWHMAFQGSLYIHTSGIQDFRYVK